MDGKKIIVALDGMNKEDALSLAWLLSGKVWGFKVNDLIIRYGLDIIKSLKSLGNVFADPKLHDTPQTVANSVSHLSAADLITVHASAGPQVLKAALDNCRNSKIIAVTALTSMKTADCQAVYGRQPEETVWDLAHLAADVGCHGLVCSALDVSTLNHLNLLKVVPGIRPLGKLPNDDQERIAPGCQQADFLVIGRPITRVADPLQSLDFIIKTLN